MYSVSVETPGIKSKLVLGLGLIGVKKSVHYHIKSERSSNNFVSTQNGWLGVLLGEFNLVF